MGSRHRRENTEDSLVLWRFCWRQLEATDQEIDAFVYELYGLTDEEIAIVDGQV